MLWWYDRPLYECGLGGYRRTPLHATSTGRSISTRMGGMEVWRHAARICMTGMRVCSDSASDGQWRRGPLAQVGEAGRCHLPIIARHCPRLREGGESMRGSGCMSESGLWRGKDTLSGCWPTVEKACTRTAQPPQNVAGQSETFPTVITVGSVHGAGKPCICSLLSR